VKKAFVTGGSGFVGKRLIASLRQLGVAVNALARSDAAIAQVRAAGAEPVRGDLDDVAVLAAGMAGCDVVFHAAAYVATTGRREDFMRVTVAGTEHVLAAALQAGVQRMVHVSTEAVLVGGPKMVRADETWPRPARPLGLYPLSKGLAEERVLAANSSALTTVIVRPRFIWGAGDTTLMPNLIAAVRAGRFRWIGGGRHLTSTCHVDNVVEGMLLAADRGQGGEIYFLTDGEPVEMRAFMTAMLATQGVDPGDRTLPLWLARAAAFTVEGVWSLFGLRKQAPVDRTAVRLIGEEVTVSDDKARRELGYQSKTTRDAGLIAMKLAGDGLR
jgi:nucleoside-diphosphate-sugar epimerase